MFERFAGPARTLIVNATEAARDLGHDYIGTEHLLLGLLREGEGVAAQVIVRLGAELSQVRSAVMDALGGPAEPSQTKPEPADIVIRSLQEENRHLRFEVDRLRVALFRRGLDVEDPSPSEPVDPPDGE
jgi:ATP-dependent Clp protease ATP-binding subunit ClpA